MRLLDLIFWLFAAGVTAFIVWTLISLVIEAIRDRRPRRPVKRPATRDTGIGDVGLTLSASDYGTASTSHAAGSSDSNSSESGGGEYGGGGGEYGGGGSSGGW